MSNGFDFGTPPWANGSMTPTGDASPGGAGFDFGTPPWAPTYQTPQNTESTNGAITRGLISGLRAVPGTTGAGLKAYGETLGFAPLTRAGEWFEQYATKPPENEPAPIKLSEIDSIGKAFSFAGEQFGNAVASMLPTMAMAGAGAVAGGAAAGPLGAIGGAAVLGGSTGLMQNTGDLADSLIEEGVAPKRAYELAAKWGPVITAPDLFSAGALLKPFIAPGQKAVTKSLVRRIMSGALDGAKIEGLTEAGQQALQEGIIATETGNQNLAERAEKVATAGIGGALGGAAFGGVGGIPRPAESAPKPSGAGLPVPYVQPDVPAVTGSQTDVTGEPPPTFRPIQSLSIAEMEAEREELLNKQQAEGLKRSEINRWRDLNATLMDRAEAAVFGGTDDSTGTPPGGGVAPVRTPEEIQAIATRNSTLSMNDPNYDLSVGDKLSFAVVRNMWSRTEKSIDDAKMGDAAPAGQWSNYIKNNPAMFPPREVEYTGLTDWLAEQAKAGKKVSKAEIKDYLQANRIIIDEYRDVVPSARNFETYEEGYRNPSYYQYTTVGQDKLRYVGRYYDPEKVTANRDNYVELTLRQPFGFEKYITSATVDSEGNPKIENRIDRVSRNAPNTEFDRHSGVDIGHSDFGKNVVAFALANVLEHKKYGKMFMIEQLQSDIHQKNRGRTSDITAIENEDYAVNGSKYVNNSINKIKRELNGILYDLHRTKDTVTIDKINNAFNPVFTKMFNWFSQNYALTVLTRAVDSNNQLTDELVHASAYETLVNQLEDARADILEQIGKIADQYRDLNTSKSPDEFNFKRAMLFSSEGLSLYFTDMASTSRVQPFRNAFIDKSIKKIKTVENPAYTKNGWVELALKRLVQYAVDRGYDYVVFSNPNAIMETTGGKLSGHQLYYDKIYPETAEKLFKKYGVKVVTSNDVMGYSDGTLPGVESDGTRMQFPVKMFKITPELRAVAQREGFPVLAVSETRKKALDNLKVAPEVAAKIKDILNKMTGGRAQLEQVVSGGYMDDQVAEGLRAEGMNPDDYDARGAVEGQRVWIGYGAQPDIAYSSAYHEGYHVVENIPWMLTGQERASLNDPSNIVQLRARLLDSPYIRNFLSEDTISKLNDAEVRAYAYEDYVNNRHQAQNKSKLPALIRNVFDKIKDFFSRIKYAFTKSGMTPDDIFGAIYRGDVGARTAPSSIMPIGFDHTDANPNVTRTALWNKVLKDTSDSIRRVVDDAQAAYNAGSPHQPDLGLIASMIHTPRYIYNKFKIGRRIQAWKDAYDRDRTVILAKVVELVPSLKNVRGQELADLNEALMIGDRDKKTFAVGPDGRIEFAPGRFLTGDAAKGYTEVRNALKYMGDQVKEAMTSALLRKYKGFYYAKGVKPDFTSDALTNFFNQMPVEVPGSLGGNDKRDFKNFKSDLGDLIALHKKLDKMHSQGYIPHIWYGDRRLVVKKKLLDEKGVRIDDDIVHMESVELPEFLPDNVGARAMAGEMQRRLDAVREQYREQLLSGEYYIANGPDGSPWFRPTHDTVRQELSSSLADLNTLINTFGARDPKSMEVMQDTLDKIIGERGFRNFLKDRREVSGYSQDSLRSISTYLMRMAGWKTRQIHLDELNDIYQDPEWRKQDLSKLYEFTKNDIDYFMKPEADFARARQFTYTWYLGGRLSTAILNGFQTAVATLPYISGLTGNPGRSSKEILRAYKDAARLIKYDGPTPTVDLDKAPPELKKMLKTLFDDGRLLSRMELEQSGLGPRALQIMTSPGERVFNGYVEFSMLPFASIELVNRLVTAIAAYRVAKGDPQFKTKATQFYKNDNLWDPNAPDLATQFAKFAVDETQFHTGKANRPWAMRSVGALAFQFMTYPLEMLQTIATAIGRTKSGASKSQLAFLGGMIVMTSGVWGLPFGEDLKKLIEKLYKLFDERGINIDDMTRNFFVNTFGTTGADILLKGGLSVATGVDVARRMGLGEVGSQFTAPVLGPMGAELGAFGSIGLNNVMNAYSVQKETGDWRLAAMQIAPSVIRDIFAADMANREGVFTSKGNLTILPGQTSPLDITYRAIGFTPLEWGQTRDMVQTSKEIKTGASEFSKSVNSRLEYNLTNMYIQNMNGNTTRAEYWRQQFQRELEKLLDHNARQTNIARMFIPDLEGVALRAAINAQGAASPANLRGTNRQLIGELLRIREQAGLQ